MPLGLGAKRKTGTVQVAPGGAPVHSAGMRILASEADIAEGLKHLRKADPRLRAVIKTAGKIPLRRSEGGLTGIARIVVSQQLSSASAGAIWRKLEAAFPNLTPRAVARA